MWLGKNGLRRLIRPIVEDIFWPNGRYEFSSSSHYQNKHQVKLNKIERQLCSCHLHVFLPLIVLKCTKIDSREREGSIDVSFITVYMWVMYSLKLFKSRDIDSNTPKINLQFPNSLKYVKIYKYSLMGERE